MSPLTPVQKEKMEKEINEIIVTLIKGCETLDMDMAFGMFANIPEFIMMGTDGSQVDHDTYVNNNINYLSDCSAFDLKTFNGETRVLDENTAIYSWAYQAKATLKSGDIDMVDRAGATFVFRKIADKWKVVYYHEATVPPRRISKGE
ncbi:MAG: nuclear transport factor 2 family protein [Anaerolineaceae bacterium]|nr:nuclear transport factor 2 family protein [Anaerolineaceae bacterium]